MPGRQAEHLPRGVNLHRFRLLQCTLDFRFGSRLCKKRARAEDAQNGFLYCRLSVEVASNICCRTGKIETVLLYENSTAEFSHSLGPIQKSSSSTPTSGLPLKADIQ